MAALIALLSHEGLGACMQRPRLATCCNQNDIEDMCLCVCSIPARGRMSGRGAWTVVSLIGIAIACLIAIVLPYFDILAAIMGALGNLVAAYALPALLVLVSALWPDVTFSFE